MTIDYAAIEVDGLFLDSWTSYRFDSDLFTPADAFALQLGVGTSDTRYLRDNIATIRRYFQPGATVKFWVGSGDKRALQGTGIVDSRSITNDISGTKISIEGRDKAALLFSAADVSVYRDGATFVELARAAVSEWEIVVRADQSAARGVRTGAKGGGSSSREFAKRAKTLGIPARTLSKKLLDAIDAGTISANDFLASSLRSSDPSSMLLLDAKLSSLKIYSMTVKEARPQSGETVWEFLDRHARRLGLLMRMSPEGSLDLMAPDYEQEPEYRLRRTIESATVGTPFSGLALNPNNILSGGERYDSSEMYRQVTVTGRFRTSASTARTLTRVNARDAEDDALPFERTLRIQDDTIRSETEATKRAYRELARSRMGARVLEYEVSGHSANGRLYACDTVAHVDDEVCGISGPFYVVARSFIRDEAGPRTSLKLVPLGSIVIG